ncbi:hypothetical protein [Nitratiruptor tergarcus]|uniref:Nucleotide modification associated domain-containing protein n=1 Tax=Nitratiruptor tergarcus DSM 16512 TaxID=1069081 RepID=A0A1W1WUS2_9BACT|nr:hypothetical protein [Nitratiruptor tergarcus]SMC10074.1 hypothetical protein SAMN05660197_1909 [Nitratiruptor tergarcus DSM 16512]
MERYLIYRMTYDGGFTPNPFWGYLTVAACTPNHRRANLHPGEWIIGIESKELAKKRIAKGCNPDIEQLLIYAAKIDECLSLDQYFRDPRFQAKKFKKDGNWKEQNGDNNYYKENNKWKWIRGHEHEPRRLRDLPDEDVFFDEDKLYEYLKDEEKIKKYGVILQDLKGDRVFISKKFLYFGNKGVKFPQELLECAPKSRGFKYCRPNDKRYKELKEFIDDRIKKYGYGVHGKPINCCIDNGCNDEIDEKKSSCKSELSNKISKNANNEMKEKRFSCRGS